MDAASFTNPQDNLTEKIQGKLRVFITETKEEPTLITDFSTPSGIPRMRSCSEF